MQNDPSEQRTVYSVAQMFDTPARQFSSILSLQLALNGDGAASAACSLPIGYQNGVLEIRGNGPPPNRLHVEGARFGLVNRLFEIGSDWAALIDIAAGSQWWSSASVTLPAENDGKTITLLFRQNEATVSVLTSYFLPGGRGVMCKPAFDFPYLADEVAAFIRSLIEDDKLDIAVEFAITARGCCVISPDLSTVELQLLDILTERAQLVETPGVLHLMLAMSS